MQTHRISKGFWYEHQKQIRRAKKKHKENQEKEASVRNERIEDWNKSPKTVLIKRNSEKGKQLGIIQQRRINKAKEKN